MIDSLFDNDIDYQLSNLSIGIDLFSVKRENSLEWVKENSHKIKKESKTIFDYFFSLNNIAIDEMPQYHCSPLWGEVTNNYKLRFFIIKDNDVYHLVLIRIIGVMYHEQYACVTFKILSSDGNDASKKIIPLLRNVDCIKKIETIVNTDADWDNCNFYCTKENITTIDTKRRTQLTRSLKLLDKGVKVSVLTSITNGFSDQCDDLFDTFEKVRFKFNKKVNKNMIDMVIRDKSGFVVVFEYDKKVIGLQVVCMDFLDIASIHVAKDISSFPIDLIASKYLNGNTILAKEIRNYLGILREEFTKKHCFDKFDVKALYIDGAHGDKGKYLIHKRKHYDRCIYYKMYDINEYGIN